VDALHRLSYISPAFLPTGKYHGRTSFFVLTEVVYSDGEKDKIEIEVIIHMKV
jgi:hypothetical protein